MGRRTISNLSRELKVSRPRIYRAIDRLGIEKKAGGEYPLNEWEALKQELTSTAGVSRQKRQDANAIKQTSKAALREEAAKTKDAAVISGVAASTLQVRLDMAKQEYDYNRMMISVFQAETDVYVMEHGRTTIMSHNGSLAAIPSITNLEKYVKLNIALSKLISDLESDLDLSADGEGDPFA